jgi:hypothetical protein
VENEFLPLHDDNTSTITNNNVMTMMIKQGEVKMMMTTTIPTSDNDVVEICDKWYENLW